MEKEQLLSENINLEEKIKKIEKSEGLNKIPTQYLPRAIENNYFFISYSHKDYKSVYVDLLYLQAHNLQFWYDVEMSAGTSWELVASRHMVPFQCKGVIFYVSENSLKSDSIIKELEYAKRFNKPIVTINMPFESDYIYNGESVKGKEFSATQMLLIMRENGVEIPSFEEKKTKIEEYFPDDVLYLPHSSDATWKVKQIELKVKEIPLLEFNEDKTEIIKLNDHDLFGITKDDIQGEEKADLIVAKNLFSNCLQLKKIDFGERSVGYDSFAFAKCVNLISINNTSEYSTCLLDGAFYECEKLVEFNVNNNDCSLAGKMAFYGCSALEKVTINCLNESIPENSFAYCESLKDVSFKNAEELKVIKANAFYCCYALEHMDIPNNVTTIGKEAFAECQSLVDIALPQRLVKIGDNAFENCSALKKIVLPESLESIGYKAFDGCDELELNEYKNALYLPSKNNPYFALIRPIDREIKGFEVHPDCVMIAGGAYEDYEGELDQIQIPPKIISVGKRAFKGCDGLYTVTFKGFEKNVLINKTMKKSIIEDEAFSNCTYLAYVLVDPNLVAIGNRAFENSQFLEEIHLGISINKIGRNVFGGCEKFKKVTYDGTPSQFSMVSIDKDNEQFNKATFIFDPMDFVRLFGTTLWHWFFGALAITIVGFAMSILAVAFQKALKYDFAYNILLYGGVAIGGAAWFAFLMQLVTRIHYGKRKKAWSEKYRKYLDGLKD